jgi:hypothetical protein
MNNKIWYELGKNTTDEQYTPAYGVEILLPHIQHLKDKTIWLPFDKGDSQFVKVLRDNGFYVIHTHIEDGFDFLNFEPNSWDVLLSNPPYKNKRIYWERALSFGKPFALLLPVNILSDAIINQTMKGREKDFQLLIPNKRMRFYNNITCETGNQPTFKASYFGVSFFKERLILVDMEIKKI